MHNLLSLHWHSPYTYLRGTIVKVRIKFVNDGSILVNGLHADAIGGVSDHCHRIGSGAKPHPSKQKATRRRRRRRRRRRHAALLRRCYEADLRSFCCSCFPCLSALLLLSVPSSTNNVQMISPALCVCVVGSVGLGRTNDHSALRNVRIIPFTLQGADLVLYTVPRSPAC